MKKTLEFAELEQVYDLVALAIDAHGQENEALFFSKLVMTLAHRVGDLESVGDAIRTASAGFVD